MIKTLIVDDHAVVRDGVKRIFDEQPGEVVFGEAGTAQNAIKLVHEENWDAVVLDLSLNCRSICAYDLGQFRGDIIINIMRTHPMVIIGGILQENPFFVPPDEFVRELRERRAAQSSAT
jgi:DNA-binding NarL/FixJ family response regulator